MHSEAIELGDKSVRNRAYPAYEWAGISTRTEDGTISI